MAAPALPLPVAGTFFLFPACSQRQPAPWPSTYSTFISKLVNQVKTEIEQAFYWHALRDTFSVDTVVDTTSYTFTGAGPEAAVISAWDTTSGRQIKRGTNAQFDVLFFGVPTASIQSGAPEYYVPAGISAGYDLKIDVWPKPNA